MQKIGLIVHGGAGEDSDFIRKHKRAYEDGISKALDEGYKVLKEGGSASDAVEIAVNCLEDNPLFNAGRGSALNAKGQVEMCAAIMDGKTRNSGAVAIVHNIKNPVSLAKSIMQNTTFRYLGAHGASDYAEKINIALEVDSYFITEHQYNAYKRKRDEEFQDTRSIAVAELHQKFHGTVGAVALDKHGNLAAAASTGGTENSKEGRIGDSSMIGAGCYANNETCAVVATGDGEFIIKNVIANSIHCAMQYKNKNVQDSCDFIILQENESTRGDIGVIGIDSEGNMGITFNCERMHRGYKIQGKKKFVRVYK